MSEQTVEIEDVTVEAETDLALLCIIDDKQVWIPKSVVHEDSEVYVEGDIGYTHSSCRLMQFRQALRWIIIGAIAVLVWIAYLYA